MALVPLASLAHVSESAPTDVRVSASRSSEAVSLDIDRAQRIEAALPRISRSRADILTFERANEAGTVTTTSTTAPPPTTVKPKPKPATTAKPKPTVTTTARPRPTTTTAPPRATVEAGALDNRQEGGASFHNYTDPRTCAHRTIAKGTRLRVTNLANGKQTACIVNDRGPFVEGRILDLSRTAFGEIASTSTGVIHVSIEW